MQALAEVADKRVATVKASNASLLSALEGLVRALWGQQVSPQVQEAMNAASAAIAAVEKGDE